MVLFLMFLSALNLINRFYYCVYFAALFFVLHPFRKVRLNTSAAVLLALGLFTMIFDPMSRSGILSLIKPYTFMVSYILGLGLFQNKERDRLDIGREEKKIAKVIYLMAAGTFAHYVLNIVTNVDIEERDMNDFWTQDTLAATGHAAIACISVGVAVAFLFSQKEKRKQILGAAMLILIALCNLVLAGRTLFLLIIITIVAAVVYISATEKRKMLKTVAIVLAVVVVLVFLYSANAFDIKDTIEDSNFYNRFFGANAAQDLDDDGRLDLKLDYLKDMLKYLWGGNQLYKIHGGYAHDLYLDTHDNAGIIAFLAIVAYIVSSLVRAVKCIRNKRFGREIRLLVFCVYLVCNIMFCLEPIMRGMPWLLTAYCFIDGSVTYLLTQEERSRADYPADSCDSRMDLPKRSSAGLVAHRYKR